MDDPSFNGNAVLNAAAVWFIFKAIEVIVFVVYDTYSAIRKWMHNRGNPDPPPHEITYQRRRGWIEYAFSGVGFLNPGLCRQRRITLLIITTIIPVAVFVLELFSITLGNESRTCVTSRDPNVVSSPSLVLFGEGKRHVNQSGTVSESGFDTSRGILRPCLSWSSTHAGVNFLSNMCGDILEAADHTTVLRQTTTPNRPIGVFLPKRQFSSSDFPGLALLGLMLQSNDSLDSRVILGTFRFLSDVVVNGKSFLFQDVFTADRISEEQKNRLIQDVRSNERDLVRLPGKLLEDEDFLGFVWDDSDDYAKGAIAVVYGVLSQATREPIKTAAEMSSSNTVEVFEALESAFEVSCEEDFRLPRTASIIIIAVAVAARFILLFIPTSISSVEYAMEKSEKYPV